MSRMVIPADDVSKVREWFKHRGGVLRWHNLEIGAYRPDMITPSRTDYGQGMADTVKPHWSMGNPETLQSCDIDVTTRQPIDLPAEWFPKCIHCKGTGCLQLQAIANDIGETLHTLKTRFVSTQGIVGTDDTVRCHHCYGRGHLVKTVKGRLRRRYWGMECTTQSADRMANRLAKYHKVRLPCVAVPGEPTIGYDWQAIGYGLAEFSFFVESVQPFMME